MTNNSNCKVKFDFAVSKVVTIISDSWRRKLHVAIELDTININYKVEEIKVEDNFTLMCKI